MAFQATRDSETKCRTRVVSSARFCWNFHPTADKGKEGHIDSPYLMSFINAIFGTASKIDPAELQNELEPILIENEAISGAFKVVRDLFVFTQYRLILVDKQGLTGKKVDYHSIPYRSISQFSVETAGHFDMDAELRIWVASNPVPIKKEFKKGIDIVGLQKMLATHLLT